MRFAGGRSTHRSAEVLPMRRHNDAPQCQQCPVDCIPLIRTSRNQTSSTSNNEDHGPRRSKSLARWSDASSLMGANKGASLERETRSRRQSTHDTRTRSAALTGAAQCSQKPPPRAAVAPVSNVWDPWAVEPPARRLVPQSVERAVRVRWSCVDRPRTGFRARGMVAALGGVTDRLRRLTAATPCALSASHGGPDRAAVLTPWAVEVEQCPDESRGLARARKAGLPPRPYTRCHSESSRRVVPPTNRGVAPPAQFGFELSRISQPGDRAARPIRVPAYWD